MRSPVTHGILSLYALLPRVRAIIVGKTAYISQIIVLITIFPLLSYAAIIRVPEDYPTIPGAIEAAASGDTIIVAEDVYDDSVSIENRSLTIASLYILDGDTSHIEETRWVRPAGQVINITGEESNHVVIAGFTITSGSEATTSSSGIYIEGTQVLLDHNRFENCYSFSGSVVLRNAISEVRNNDFILNHAGYGGAISIEAGRSDVINNVFLNNSAQTAGALMLVQATDLPNTGIFISVTGNLFMGNSATTAGGAISAYNVDTLIVQDNVFQQNYAVGMSIGGAIEINSYINWCVVEGNRFEENTADWMGGALHLSSPGEVADNLFLHNSANIYSAISAQDFNDTGSFTVYCHNNAFIHNVPLNRETVNYAAVSAVHFATLTLEENDFYDNELSAIKLFDQSPGTIEVTNNYWGYASGPYQPEQNPDGEGDTVAVGIDVLPFAEEPFTDYRRPEPFDLVSPEDGARPPLWVVTFRWRATTSPNPGGNDSLTYRVETALDSAFAFPASRHNAGRDTTLTVEVDPDSVAVLWWRVYVEDALGIRRYSSEVRRLDWTDAAPEQGQRGPPERWEVRRVYPNPFNSAVRVTVALPRAGPLRAAVYDLTGRCVALLHDGPAEAGERELVWRPGPGTASGVYLLRLSSGSWTAARKVVYLK
ncbi:MAG TPA: T9SS type A sorting domain-containing protein [Bacteroidetes bacterium]|nr:T9SS type A sorting domain-containing protein [Bacteroidota bacterium]